MAIGFLWLILPMRDDELAEGRRLDGRAGRVPVLPFPSRALCASALNEAWATVAFLSAASIAKAQGVLEQNPDTLASTVVYAHPDRTPTTASLTAAVANAQSLGLNVMLKPHVDNRRSENHR